jgi:acyl-CoA thioesterase I
VTAIGGENAEAGAARFDRDVLSLRPDVVTIDYSLNDRAIGLERARVAWSSMIQKAQAAGVKVILMTPTPDTRAKQDAADDPLQQHAEQVRQLARQYHVGLADSMLAFRRRVETGAKLENLMSHVNHPNRSGHDTVAKELFLWFPSSAARGS